MKTINLNVLIQAHTALEMLREASETSLSTEQYMHALRAWSRLGAEIESLTKQVDVEVTQ
tara:strand:- start:848 stop:1027 length:180 start_codon:yes stop_codon:yes gene_type:complete